LSLERLLTEDEPGTADCANDVDTKVDFDTALLLLTDTQRKYLAKRVEGYSYAEIARLVGKDRSTVRESICSAKKKIREYFV
jgi:DNA-directed RNA polymerase specialized sigma24 family protein